MSANSATSPTAGIWAVGVLLTGAAITFCAVATADPAPPALPAPAPAPSPLGPTVPVAGAPLGLNGLAVLGQSGAPAPGPLGAPQVPGLDASTVLGQNIAPAPPGAGPGAPPNLRIFNNAYGIAQNVTPAAPDQGVQFDVAPGQENADVSRREWFGRYIDMYHAGMLKGGLLGQMPQDRLGQPLPGTAPPPDTNIPPGPVQFLPTVAPQPPGAPG
ncbi:hypothetical protein AU193_14530 [Mycobacterium sp. GA-1285]|uniref:hypothetical protein n=1 Tax=Mycobacterium sp. GA-1285 TaxID=1772282 RepID=UPI00074AE3CA|nr:hypothetical protein [Mycobacterium sp. GA-1285]KUI17614.1 hypothetical protein AU193_14530 [Mycobacterium sp. GA-1285]